MEQIIHVPKNELQVPVARIPISVRLATVDDIPFIDELQKMHQKQLGWTPRKTIEGKIAAGHVLVAEENRHEGTDFGELSRVEAQRHEGSEEAERDEVNSLDPSSLIPHSVPSSLRASVPVGYCISQDKYMGHEDLGIIYQMNVVPGHQRNLIGASLVKAVFERAAYGCRLFCCWCAQDIAANYFWESLGFVPLAFRAGNRGKRRVHIFWQRRIREGDVTTPYWFPSETRGGMMNEARLVLPIPPGTKWQDAKPIVLPAFGSEAQARRGERHEGTKALRHEGEIQNRKSKIQNEKPKQTTIKLGGLRLFAEAKVAVEKPKRQPRVKQKNDPKYVAAARELRDRYLEHVASGAYLPEPSGKYEVSKTLSQVEGSRTLPEYPLEGKDVRLLTAA